jgi:hypothetical protein
MSQASTLASGQVAIPPVAGRISPARILAGFALRYVTLDVPTRTNRTMEQEPNVIAGGYEPQQALSSKILLLAAPTQR